jgi:hypothetical protein
MNLLKHLPDWSRPGMIRNDQQDFTIFEFGLGQACLEYLFHLPERE